MINNDRIVPIEKIDLISMYGTMFNIASATYTALAPNDTDGNFSVTSAGAYLANQPVKSLDFANGVASGTVFFVPAYNFVGFTKDGAAATVKGTVNADGVTLYKAALASGNITVTAMTPVV